MLTTEQNALLTRVEPGTPMHELMSRYWIPALLETEVPERNGDPVRFTLLGLNLVAWRDQDGRVGVFREACMHRGASLALARSEGDGLRCLYHGWKFATDGRILDIPNHRSPDRMKERFCAPTFPVHEAANVVWVYLGPPERLPDLPAYPFTKVPRQNCTAQRIVVDANYLQALEGTIDSSHTGILHEDWDFFGARMQTQHVGMLRVDTAVSSDDDAPDFEVEETEFGLHIVAIRDADRAGERVRYARVYKWVQPFSTLIPPAGHTFCVPIDNEHTSFLGFSWNANEAADPAKARDRLQLGNPVTYEPLAPGVWHFLGTAENGWTQDRARMRSESFSGVAGLVAEDFAMQMSMGTVFDRSMEHLIPADLGVIEMRRMLLRTLQKLADGIEPSVPSTAVMADLGWVPDAVITDGNWHSLLDASRALQVPDHPPEMHDVAPG